ncbi:MAG: polyphosphate:AMP phosphotransferase [Gemmataceae bacterium]
MLEVAEIGNRIDKQTYKDQAPQVRTDLLQAQRELAAAPFSVIVLLSGVEGGGKASTMDMLLAWLDARGIQTHAIDQPTDEERQRPPLWRFWRLLPPHGRMGIFLRSWYMRLFLDSVRHGLDRAALGRTIQHIVHFERMLHHENTLIVKFWLHMSKDAIRSHFRKLEADPLQSWRVTKEDWQYLKRYDDFRLIAEEVLRETSTSAAPWHIVEAVDRRYRDLTVARTLWESLRQRLDSVQAAPPRSEPKPTVLHPDPINILNQLDMSKSLNPKEYKKKLLKLQGKINILTRRLHDERRSMILVFEGPDAAGKGGTIRRLTAAMDARDYQVIAVAAPTDEELAHPYLWRFWRHLPRLGRITIYDRSWYGRVLVERIEGFCTQDEWQRAYEEINEFEDQLTEFGVILLKFYIALTPDEQLRRFQDRETTPYKQYKLTEEDWRNRDKWDSYQAAACDMIAKTSTPAAPWILVEGNDKNWARIKVLSTIVDRLEQNR